MVEGREFAVPDDAKALAPKVFGHRVVPATRGGVASRRSGTSVMAGERIIEELLAGIAVPL
jgi:MoxR-like ATPase